MRSYGDSAISAGGSDEKANDFGRA